MPVENTRVKLTFGSKCSRYSDRIPLKSTWFLVDGSLKTVEDVQAKIGSRYAIKAKKLNLFVEDCHIPSCESANVFRENDVILVKIRKKRGAYAQETKETETSCTSETGIVPPESGSKNRKRKRDTGPGEVQDTSGPSAQPTKISNGDKSTLVEVVEIERKKSNEQNGSERSTLDISIASESKLEDSIAETPETKKRRRKRTRTRKKKDQEVAEHTPAQDIQKQRSLNTFISKLHITHPEPGRSSPLINKYNPGHVHFSDDEVDARRVGHAAEYMETSEPTATCESVHFVVNTEREAASIVNMTKSFEEDSVSSPSPERIQTDSYAAVSNDGVYSNRLTRRCVSSPVVHDRSWSDNHNQSFNDQEDVPPEGGDVLEILQACKGASPSVSHKKSKKSATDVVKNAVVFSRKNFQWKRFSPLSKAQQLASKQENTSVIYENPPRAATNEVRKQSRNQPDYSAMNFQNLPALKEPPAIGRKVAFKMLELGADFTPGVSDFKVAKVLLYDHSSKCLKLELLSGNVGGMLLDDNIEAEKIVTLQWTSMLEPKVVEEERL